MRPDMASLRDDHLAQDTDFGRGDMAIEPARVMAVRLPGLPIRIDMLAHCRSRAEADKIVDDEALAATRTAYGDWYRSITKLWHDHDDHSVDELCAWETATQNETVLFGSPARVREQVRRLVEESGCNYVICSFVWGTLPHQQALRSLQLFAQEVMPAISGTAVLA
jgi:alkanesulfonate monooxygenase SsuD/methylene tetrahydromethanopterin reductase-like flavin-dependent oxidoreductase (luciferase family)